MLGFREEKPPKKIYQSIIESGRWKSGKSWKKNGKRRSGERHGKLNARRTRVNVVFWMISGVKKTKLLCP